MPLAGSVLELQRMVEQYVPFSDDVVFGSVALLEWFFRSHTSISTDVLPTPLTIHWKRLLHPSVDPQRIYTSPGAT